MVTFVRAVRRVSQLCGIVAAALIALGVLVVCHMVFVRYVLNQNTIWQTDLTTYCLIAATFVGSPFVLMTRGHVNVDVLPHYLGPRARLWIPYSSMPIGLGLLSLQYVADIYNLVTGREPPFGITKEREA